MKNSGTKPGCCAIAPLQAKTRRVLAIAPIAVMGFTFAALSLVGCGDSGGW